jgi:hypothetical protein
MGLAKVKIILFWIAVAVVAITISWSPQSPSFSARWVSMPASMPLQLIERARRATETPTARCDPGHTWPIRSWPECEVG